MDFFKPGSFSIHIINPDGSLREIDASTDFQPIAQGESMSACDCPPGVCLGDSEAAGDFPEFLAAMFGGGPSDDEIHDEADDFDFCGEIEEAVHPADRLEAVAQLGRITESLATLANLQARLVSDLLEG
jgi:hypothetical protein